MFRNKSRGDDSGWKCKTRETEEKRSGGRVERSYAHARRRCCPLHTARLHCYSRPCKRTHACRAVGSKSPQFDGREHVKRTFKRHCSARFKILHSTLVKTSFPLPFTFCTYLHRTVCVRVGPNTYLGCNIHGGGPC